MDPLNFQTGRFCGRIKGDFKIIEEPLHSQQAGKGKISRKRCFDCKAVLAHIQRYRVYPYVFPETTDSLALFSPSDTDIGNPYGITDLFVKHAIVGTRIYQRLEKSRRGATLPA